VARHLLGRLGDGAPIDVDGHPVDALGLTAAPRRSATTHVVAPRSIPRLYPIVWTPTQQASTRKRNKFGPLGETPDPCSPRRGCPEWSGSVRW